MGTTENGSSGAAASQGAARILVADDHALVREGLRTMLSGEEGLRVVGEAHDGEQALEACRKLRPDLVLMDVRMPRMDGLEATRRIKAEMPQTSVVMVTMHESPDYLLEAVRAGAAGYVLKDASGERLLGAVRRTLEGESPLDQELAMRLLTRLAKVEEAPATTTGGASAGDAPSGEAPSEEAPAEASGGRAPDDRAEGLEGLTPREVEVLRLLSRGQTNPQIAHNLLISRGTAKIHVQHIISKLGVSDRTQAAVRAIEAGLL
ncbi:MAG: response regulator transcription factor, partial [Pyrinomonadaceae bacterium]|nr:response regulator transcription factor [Pyrinomonadaceae bacterium]